MSELAAQPLDRILACLSERVALMAGVLVGAVMADELSLADGPGCFRLMHARELMALGYAEIDDLIDAKLVATRMLEDRARRAVAYRDAR